MSTTSRDDATRAAVPDARPGAAAADPDGLEGWVASLSSTGADQLAAMRRLHALMVRAAAHQVWRMRGALPDPSPRAVDDLANQAADEAMTALLAKLHTFEGRSRFTTWAFKFAVLQAATEVRRVQWQHREVELRDLEVVASEHDAPGTAAEVRDLGLAVERAMRTALTPHQRRVALALLVDEVPIDVLAQRLGTSRGALYKTVHDVRVRLRAELVTTGHLDATAPRRRAGTR